MIKQGPNSGTGKKISRVPSESSNGTTTLNIKVFLVVLAISALLVGVYIQLTKNLNESLKRSSQEHSNTATTLIIAANSHHGYLDHVIDTLLKFGHNLAFTSPDLTSAKLADLDQYKLIWMHDYPFHRIKKLEPRQRINHFPGTGFITNKMMLSTSPRVPHILKAFHLPAEKDKFLAYSKQHLDRLWIQKSSSHRGISIRRAEFVDLQADDTLVQEYMANPLLIDGKKFDIGIYAVLSSVEPLRVYTYEAESLLRFCAKPYIDKQTNKFNESDLDSYVVGDDYTPIWLMPSLLRYYIGTNLSMKQTLNTYLKQFNKDGNKIWRQIDETIRWVYKLKEHHIARMSRMFQAANNYNDTSVVGSLNQFFEMVRFDFIVDEDLKVYLMEANMSPNLSSRHFPPNRLLYEQVLSSYFSLVGLTEFPQKHLYDLPINHLNGKLTQPLNSIKFGPNMRYGLNEVISEKELSVYEDLCVSDECHLNCDKVDCKVCYFCLNDADKLHLRRAIFEHHSKWNFKRLMPSTRDEDLNLQLTHPDKQVQEVDANYVHVQWFRGKCHSDKTFCSLN